MHSVLRLIVLSFNCLIALPRHSGLTCRRAAIKQSNYKLTQKEDERRKKLLRIIVASINTINSQKVKTLRFCFHKTLISFEVSSLKSRFRLNPSFMENYRKRSYRNNDSIPRSSANEDGGGSETPHEIWINKKS